MPLGWESVREKSVVAIITAFVTTVVLGAATLIWNWASAGGAVHALRGMTQADVNDYLEQHASSRQEQFLKDETGRQITGQLAPIMMRLDALEAGV
jgi:hypothetical protein